MDIERGRLIEIAVSVAAVGTFVVVLVGIGILYNEDGMDGEGGLALVAAIGLFVLVMGALGYALANVQYDDE